MRPFSEWYLDYNVSTFNNLQILSLLLLYRILPRNASHFLGVSALYRQISSLGDLVRLRQPSAVTSSMSSMRTPYLAGR